MKRRTFIGSSIALGGAAALGGLSAPGCGKKPKEVVYRDVKRKQLLIVADGLDFNRIGDYMERNRLPNLAKVATSGGVAPVIASYPQDHYSAAAALVTGKGPDSNGVFSAAGRDPKIYLPRFLPYEYAGAKTILGLATSLPKAKSNLQGDTLWDRAIDDGVRTLALKAPFATPLDIMAGSYVTGGLGTPDVTMAPGRYQYFATDIPEELPDFLSPFGKINRLEVDKGRGDLILEGPPVNGESTRLRISFEIMNPQIIDIILNGSRYSLNSYQFSDYLAFEFPVGDTGKVRAIGRIRVMTVSPHLRIYVSPLGFAPTEDYMGQCIPNTWFAEDGETKGYIRYTPGADIYPYLEGVAPRAILATDVYDADEEVKQLASRVIAAEDFGLIALWFSGIDAAQRTTIHMLDEEHPNYHPGGSRYFSDLIDIAYKHLDDIAGELIAALPDAEVTIASAYGCVGVRRLFNTNAWLHQNGYLAGEARDLPIRYSPYPDGEDYWDTVDWAKSKAYALGYGHIYLNRKGREKDGVASEDEVNGLLDEITKELKGVKDGGNAVIETVHRGSKIFPGLPNAPDLIIEIKEGYRVGWYDTIGGIPKEVFEDNKTYHSGDFRSITPNAAPGCIIGSRVASGDKVMPEDIAKSVMEGLDGGNQ
ncbi:MAG: hypothetical protein GY771_13085 [bacterium]|nr:hypothetical protein [bacterium]